MMLEHNSRAAKSMLQDQKPSTKRW